MKKFKWIFIVGSLLVLLVLFSNSILKKEKIQPKKTSINSSEYLIEYTAGNWSMNIGAESFFFEEGQGEKYEKAT